MRPDAFGLIALAFVRTRTDEAGNRFTQAGATSWYGSAQWAGGFALMAMAMVAARTLGLVVRFGMQSGVSAEPGQDTEQAVRAQERYR